MKKFLQKLAIILINGLICATVGYIIYLCKGPEKGPISPNREVIIQRDTITLRDTIRVEKPIYITQRVTDTVKIVYTLTDTLFRNDTIYLPREEKIYVDSLFTAQVSGVQPSLDWIDVYPKTKIVTISEKCVPKRWGISLVAGYGATRDGLSPIFAVGVTYDLAQW